MNRRPQRRRKDDEPQPWCVIAWIVWLPESHGAISPPYKNVVSGVIRRVNRIFEDCRIEFKVCETIRLDATQVQVGDRSLAHLFAADGSITLSNTVRPSVFLQDFVMNGNNAAFTAKMRERCLHLFFVHELKYENAASPERGSGGWFGADTARTCYAMAGTRGIGSALNPLAQTVAHEFGHALGLSPNDDHSTADENLMKATLEPDDTKLDAAQCQLLSASLQAHIRRGCP